MYKTIEVDIDLDEFDTDDMVVELRRRGVGINPLDLNTVDVDADELREILENLYHKRRQGLDYERELDQLIWHGLGRI